MKLAILHYHLNRGGVAGVIANQLRALNEVAPRKGAIAVALIHGGRCAGWPAFSSEDLRHLEFSQHAVPLLDYDEQAVGSCSSPQLAAQIFDVLSQRGFQPSETVLHTHNHALGKNTRLPSALIELAQAGYGLLLQLHDFAEDFRPDNYQRLQRALAANHPDQLVEQLYPQGSRIHYALLNHRDLNILRDSGFTAARLHYVPNIVRSINGLAGAGARKARPHASRPEPSYTIGLELPNPLDICSIRFVAFGGRIWAKCCYGRR